MINAVSIKNYKSVSNLKLELGRFNVLIGENGCGKSNILEAIAFGSAASVNQLDDPLLAARGIRLTTPNLFRSAFEKNFDSTIDLAFTSGVLSDKMINTVVNDDGAKKVNENKRQISFKLSNSNKAYDKWIDLITEKNAEKIKKELLDFFNSLTIGNKPELMSEADWQKLQTENKDSSEKILKLAKRYSDEDSFDKGYKVSIEKMLLESNFDAYLSEYKIYSPENSFLRIFADDDSAKPLGIKGTGLFKLLKYFSEEKRDELEKLKEELHVLDWFEDFELPTNLSEGEQYLKIKDRHLDKGIDFIPQHNANEGFLFLLFYLVLFISEKTPHFFAIDNIEASFNPKLCKKLTQILVELSKKEDKQAILTTHNPFILDGLDLSDDEQRLFVVYRNSEGKTIAKRVMQSERNYELSYAWMNGYLGGLPKNF